MKKVIFVFLWAFVCWLVGVVLSIVFINVSSSLREKHPVLEMILVPVNLLILFGPATLALVLGVFGKLPGTRDDKSSSAASTPSSNSPLPSSLPPVLPSSSGPKQLSRDDLETVLEGVIQRKFGQDIPLLDSDLFGVLISCVVDKKTFNLIGAQSGRPSDQNIAAFERTIGFDLPQDFRAFVKTGFGCLYLEVNESVWPRPKVGDIVPAWHMNYALYVFGLSADVPDFMDIRKQFAAFSKSGRRIVPFLRLEGSRDQYCFTPEGGIVLWKSEMQETEPVNLSFTALLIKEIETLLDGAKKIQTEPNPYAEFGDNPKPTGR